MMMAFFQFISNYFSIKDERTHKTLRKGPAEDGIYRIPWIALPSLQQGAKTIIRVRISLEDWQAGLGSLQFPSVLSVIKNFQLPCSNSLKVSKQKCTLYCLGKFSRITLPGTGSLTNEPLSLVHVDF
jgi:hypothetical protein